MEGQKVDSKRSAPELELSMEPPPKQKGWKAHIPSFVVAHMNEYDIKAWIKASVAAWIALLLVFINPTLRFLGQAAFFGVITMFFAPPAGVILIHVMASMTAIMGICLAWAWGVITMKAALAARPAADTQRRLMIVQQMAGARAKALGITPQAAAQQVIFDGVMLDARVTAVYFSMGLTFIYFMARLRQKSPKLTLLSIFAIIITDIFLTTAPNLPSFNGTIPKTLILPAAIGIGIGLVCSLLIFPRSTSHLTLGSFRQILEPLKSTLKTTQKVFEDFPRLPHIEHVQADKAKIQGMFSAIAANLAFLPLDVSVGRWNPDDILTLRPHIRKVVIRVTILANLYITRANAVAKRDKRRKKVAAGGKIEYADEGVADHQNHLLFDLMKHLEHDNQAQLTLEMEQILQEPAIDLLEACMSGLDTIDDAFHVINSRRWLKRPSESDCKKIADKHEACLQDISAAKVNLNAVQSRLMEPIAHLFDDDGKILLQNNKNATMLRSLVFGMNMEERLSRVAESIHDLLAHVIQLERQRTATKLWLPTKIQKLFAWGFGKSPAPANGATSDPENPADEDEFSESDDEDSDSEGSSNSEAGLKLRKVPTVAKKPQPAVIAKRKNSRNKFGQLLVGFTEWFSNEEGMFAIRMVLVSFALAIPAVLPRTAGFYYREKGLWGLIMGQTGLTIYMADLVIAVVGRTVGTVIGGIVGMLAWYIGSGLGPGNSYGLAAISAPFLMIFMFLRLYAPPAYLQVCILGAATFVLVVGYSYIDSHLNTYGNPGYGYSVFWRRLLLVMVGFAATIAVQLFPAPPSATTHVANGLASFTNSIAHLYSSLVSTWINVPETTEERVIFESSPEDQKLRHTANSRAQQMTVKILEKLALIGPSIRSVAFEPSSSPFTCSSLTKIHALMTAMTDDLAMMVGHLDALPPHLQERFKAQTAATNEALVADVLAVLTMVSSSLRTGEALPAIMPCPLVGRSVALTRVRGFSEIKKELLEDKMWPSYSVLTAGFITFLSRIDELVIAVKKATGESYTIEGDTESGGWGFGNLVARQRETEEIKEAEEDDKEKAK